MYTIITYPGLEDHKDRLESVAYYTVGAKVLDDYLTSAGSHLTFAMSLGGRYMVYVHGRGYHRLTVMDSRTEALRLFRLLREIHEIGTVGIS